MRMVTRIMVVIGATLSFSAGAAITPVYQINENTGTYLQAVIGHDIYRYSHRNDLSDLVVMDNQGNKLPYRIVAPAMEISEKSEATPVRFFPVAVGTAPETLLALSSASIHVDDNAISVVLEKATNEDLVDKAVPVDFYVVDISELKTHADNLTIDWRVNEINQYLEVDVSGTNDLQHWHNIAQSTLVQLQKDGEQLTRNTIALDLVKEKYAYLRLKFLRGSDNLQLEKITIHNRQTHSTPIATDAWQLRGSLAKNQTSAQRTGGTLSGPSVAAWEFTRNDIAPITTVDIHLGENIYGDAIKVFSRANAKNNWQLVHQGIWFNVQVGEVWQQSEAVNIQRNSDPYWRIELNEFVRTSVDPTLVFHRQPQILQFVANNAAPYAIAIDNAASTASQYTSAKILAQLIAGKEIGWTTVALIELNPKLDSFTRSITHINWKTLLFWGVLLLSLGILIGVVIKLLKQIKPVGN